MNTGKAFVFSIDPGATHLTPEFIIRPRILPFDPGRAPLDPGISGFCEALPVVVESGVQLGRSGIMVVNTEKSFRISLDPGKNRINSKIFGLPRPNFLCIIQNFHFL